METFARVCWESNTSARYSGAVLSLRHKVVLGHSCWLMNVGRDTKLAGVQPGDDPCTFNATLAVKGRTLDVRVGLRVAPGGSPRGIPYFAGR